MEQWKKIEQSDGYEISNLGRVRRDEKDGTYFYLKIMPVGEGNPKYYTAVNIKINGKKKTFTVHRLLAIAFIPNPDGKPEVNHKDGNKRNYSLDNLEWATGSENQKHASMTELRKTRFGEDAPNAKLSDKDRDFIVANCKKNGGVYSQSELARMFDVTRALVSAIVLGKTRVKR